jgi:hypothetical protein
MVWEVEYTDEFEAWWNTLSEDEQAEVNSKVELLEELWSYALSSLRRRDHNFATFEHELRGKSGSRHLRVLFAFDPRRTALLLIGGDKTDDPAWYERFVPIADALFDRHVGRLGKK